MSYTASKDISVPAESEILPMDMTTPNDAPVDDAIAFFNERSEFLSQSYYHLQNKVVDLRRELDEAQAEKEAEHKNKELIANRLEALLEFLPGGVIVIDEKGYIIQSNPAARNMLQHSLDGSLWRDLITKCFAPRNDDGLEVSTPEGRRISIATASLDNSGQIILLTDQTETRRLQDQVSRNEKLSAMGKMVSALAHQIRTPLSAAILYADQLNMTGIAEAKRIQISQKVLGRLKHMEKQVRDMLLFVRNELPLNEEITLRDLECGLKAAIEVPLTTSQSYCMYVNSKPSLRFRCNREALISALSNLVNNAIQAKGKGVNMAVHFSNIRIKDQPHLKITVVDDGPGMSKLNLEAAKDIFYTTKTQGTGLGLAVVQSVARAHGGYFLLHSKLGRGARASIIIPLGLTSLTGAKI